MTTGSRDWKAECKHAAQIIKASKSILISAGAGLGVDSGLPDFRGTQGFWKAYPPFAKLGLSFADVANPKWFFQRPAQAWGFYGHRYNLYRQTEPHAGFHLLSKWCRQFDLSYFIFTSNVDGHFQRSGFDSQRIVECHGSLNHWQCAAGCTSAIGDMGDFEIRVDPESFLAAQPLPACPDCGIAARPNVLMFGDYQWIDARTSAQVERYQSWQRQIRSGDLVVIELGAGKAVPTVRWESESQRGQLIRINPRDPDVPAGGISIARGALEALEEIDQWMENSSHRADE